MGEYRYLVFSNCQPGTDEAFNRWYDDQHLPDVLAIPGFEAATRMRLPDPQAGKHRYLAIYSISSNQVDETLAELMSRAGTERMPISDTLDPDVGLHLYEVITPEHSA